MNRNLNGAMFELRKAEALLHSFECLYLDYEFLPEEKEKAEHGAYIFYCLRDAVIKAIDSIQEYEAECKIVDVIRAAREAQGIEP